MTTIFESLRPTSLGQIVGQSAAVAKLKQLNGDYGGRAYWVSGLSGTGKTTIANIISADFHVTNITPARLTPAVLREWWYSTRGRFIGGDGQCLVVNEAHGLRQDTVRELLEVIESLPEYACIVMTTTTANQASFLDESEDVRPLISRCFVNGLELSRPTLEQAEEIAAYLVSVAELRGGSLELADAMKLVRKNKHNIRACLSEIEFS